MFSHLEILRQVEQLKNDFNSIPSVQRPSVCQIHRLSGLQPKIIHQFFYHCKATVNIYHARKEQYMVNNIYMDINSNKIFTNVFDTSLRKQFYCSIYLKIEKELTVSKYTDLVCPFCICTSCGTTVE